MTVPGIAVREYPVEPTPSERMRRLERRADVVRSRLVSAVAALDTRRHQVVEIGRQAKKLARPAALSAVGVAAVVGLGAMALGFALTRRRKPKTLGDHLLARIEDLDLGRFVRREPSLLRRLAEKTALSLVSVIAAETARRAMKNLVDGRLPDGRMAVGRALDAHHGMLAHPALASASPASPVTERSYPVEDAFVSGDATPRVAEE